MRMNQKFYEIWIFTWLGTGMYTYMYILLFICCLLFQAQSCKVQRLNGAATPCFETNIARDLFLAYIHPKHPNTRFRYVVVGVQIHSQEVFGCLGARNYQTQFFRIRLIFQDTWRNDPIWLVFWKGWLKHQKNSTKHCDFHLNIPRHPGPPPEARYLDPPKHTNPTPNTSVSVFAWMFRVCLDPKKQHALSSFFPQQKVIT